MAGNAERWLQLCLPFKITPVFASFPGKHLCPAWLSALSAAAPVLPPGSRRADRNCRAPGGEMQGPGWCRPGVSHGPPPQTPLWFFFASLQRGGSSPTTSPTTETTQGGKWTWWCSLPLLCLPEAGIEVQQRGSRLDTLPQWGLNRLALSTGLPCLQRLGFAGISTPKVLGTPLCSLQPAYREEGGWLSLLYPC